MPPHTIVCAGSPRLGLGPAAGRGRGAFRQLLGVGACVGGCSCAAVQLSPRRRPGAETARRRSPGEPAMNKLPTPGARGSRGAAGSPPGGPSCSDALGASGLAARHARLCHRQPKCEAACASWQHEPLAWWLVAGGRASIAAPLQARRRRRWRWPIGRESEQSFELAAADRLAALVQRGGVLSCCGLSIAISSARVPCIQSTVHFIKRSIIAARAKTHRAGGSPHSTHRHQHPPKVCRDNPTARARATPPGANSHLCTIMANAAAAAGRERRR